jgi:hypothetical protein
MFGMILAWTVLASAGCGPLTFEAPTYYKNTKAGFKPGTMWEVSTTAHSRKQKIVVQVRSDGVPVDVCAIYDMPNRTKAAKEDVKKGEKHLDALDHVLKEPNPTLKFELMAKQPLRVIVFNSSDRTPDVELEIKTE